MSNRGRQNVASFLTKDLQIDWRLGAEFFESHLIDYEVRGLARSGESRLTFASSPAFEQVSLASPIRHPFAHLTLSHLAAGATGPISPALATILAHRASSTRSSRATTYVICVTLSPALRLPCLSHSTTPTATTSAPGCRSSRPSRPTASSALGSCRTPTLTSTSQRARSPAGPSSSSRAGRRTTPVAGRASRACRTATSARRTSGLSSSALQRCGTRGAR